MIQGTGTIIVWSKLVYCKDLLAQVSNVVHVLFDKIIY